MADVEVKGQAPESPSRQRRSMKTARSVIIIDKTADWVIRIGGLGVILAVFGIMIFLAQVVVPLFTGASLESSTSAKVDPGPRPLMEVIDEYKVLSTSVDAIGKVRSQGASGGGEERDQTLNALLVEMDGFSSDQSVIVLAATNRPETLDPALLRPGRFDRNILVDRPDIKGREEILKVHAAKIKTDDSVNLKYLSKFTAGFVGGLA